jgi:MOSC domain-containing protein YiiM
MQVRQDRASIVGTVVSVNVGRAREVERNGRIETTAIWKKPVEGRLAVRGVNVEGRPDHEITVGLVARASLRDHSLAPRLLEVAALSASWVEWAEAQAKRLRASASR